MVHEESAFNQLSKKVKKTSEAVRSLPVKIKAVPKSAVRLTKTIRRRAKDILDSPHFWFTKFTKSPFWLCTTTQHFVSPTLSIHSTPPGLDLNVGPGLVCVDFAHSPFGGVGFPWGLCVR